MPVTADPPDLGRLGELGWGTDCAVRGPAVSPARGGCSWLGPVNSLAGGGAAADGDVESAWWISSAAVGTPRRSDAAATAAPAVTRPRGDTGRRGGGRPLGA